MHSHLASVNTALASLRHLRRALSSATIFPTKIACPPPHPMDPPLSLSSTAHWNGTCELDVAHAGRLLSSGFLVAFPTETVYGLGADATNETAVRKIFAAKGRPTDNPLIVHIPSASSLTTFNFVDSLSTPAQRLADTFWPGPLTLVLPLSNESTLASSVTAGLKSVGVRVPRHPVAAALLSAARVPVAAPSANRSGRPSPTSAQHVLADLDGRIAGVLDGDAPTQCPVGLESTVVDATRMDRLVVLRPGALSRRLIASVAKVPVFDASMVKVDPTIPAPAPGMKYRHYAPTAPLRVVPREKVRETVGEEVGGLEGVIGVLADRELCAELKGLTNVFAVPCGRRGDALSAAQDLYAALRAFDEVGGITHQGRCVRVIIAAALEDPADGLGAAFMNRLWKAESGGHVEQRPASVIEKIEGFAIRDQ